MARYIPRRNFSTSPKPVQKPALHSFDCPHCGELIELNANFQPLATAASLVEASIPAATPVILATITPPVIPAVEPVIAANPVNPVAVTAPTVPAIITEPAVPAIIAEPAVAASITEPVVPVIAAQPVVQAIETAPVVPLSAVKQPQSDTSSRLRHLLDEADTLEAAAAVVEEKPAQPVLAAPARQAPSQGNFFSSATLALAATMLFVVCVLGLGVVVYNSTAPLVTPAVHVSIPTRNPTKEALQNKPLPADQTQAPVFLPTVTTAAAETTAATTPPQTAQVDINQPARTNPPTQDPAQAAPTQPVVLGPAFGTTKPSDNSGIASSSSGSLDGGSAGANLGNGPLTTIAPTSSPDSNPITGSGGGANSAAPTLPARTFAPAPPVLQVNGQAGRVYQVAFSPDGKSLATANDDNSVRLWDSVTGKPGKTFWGHTGPVYSLAFSPDGQFIASGGVDKNVYLWNVATGKLVRTMTGHTAEVNSITFSPGGQILATGSTDFSIRLWDVNTGSQVGIAQGHKGPVQTVAFSPDGKMLGSAGDDQLIMLWDLSSLSNPTLRSTLKGHNSRIFLVAFSPDSKLLASASLATSSNLKVWDLDKGIELLNLTGHDQAVYSLAFSPEGKLLASGGLDRTVRMWDPRSGTLLGTYTGASGTITSVTFSPDGKSLVGAGEDQIIRLWKVEN